MSVVKLVDKKSDEETYENDKIAAMFLDAAQRARRGDFQSVCWIAVGRDDTSAMFGWQKFGSITPLIGAVTTTLHSMCDSPHTQLQPLETIYPCPKEDDDAEMDGEVDPR